LIDKQKLKEIMQFVINKYPKGCASYNWQNNCYINIVQNKKEIEDYEIENIIKECMDEFIYEDLNLCGCGNPEETWEVIKLILSAQNQKGWENKKNKLNNICNINIDENNNYDGLIQFVLYILDNHEFLEHGGCISSAWLTTKGKLFLELLNMWDEIEDKARR
jgi:hypothetical protein